MFMTNDFDMGRVYAVMLTNGVRVLGRISRIDHFSNIVEFNATVYNNGREYTGRYAVRCAYIETVGDNVMGRG